MGNQSVQHTVHLSAIGQLPEHHHHRTGQINSDSSNCTSKSNLVLRSEIRVSQNHRRHKTYSFTGDQSFMSLLFVQVQGNVCFTVKEY